MRLERDDATGTGDRFLCFVGVVAVARVALLARGRGAFDASGVEEPPADAAAAVREVVAGRAVGDVDRVGGGSGGGGIVVVVVLEVILVCRRSCFSAAARRESTFPSLPLPPPSLGLGAPLFVVGANHLEASGPLRRFHDRVQPML